MLATNFVIDSWPLHHCTPTPIWKIHRRGGAITSKHEQKKNKTGFLCTGKQQSRRFWNSSPWRSFPKAPFLLLAHSCKKLFARRLEAKPKRKSYVFKNSHVSMDKTSVPPVIKIGGKDFFLMMLLIVLFLDYLLTQCCYTDLFLNAQLSLASEKQRRPDAVLESSERKSPCSASCWPGSFCSAVDGGETT